MVAAPPGTPNKVAGSNPTGMAQVHGAASTSATRQSPVQQLQSSTSDARARSPIPATQQLRTSASGRVRASNSTSSASNFPDVTADIYDPSNNQEDSPDIPGPDYPLDSLPRHASVQSLGAQGPHRALPGSGVGPRQSQSFSGGREGQEGRSTGDHGHTRVSDPLPVVPVTRYVPSSVVTAPLATGPVTATPRSTTATTSHIFSVPMVAAATTSQAQISHSNVVVSVNHSLLSSADPRQIHTQNLNVGVVSRLDPNRQPPTILPDLLAHSQPQPSSRVSQSQSRTAVPTTDLRISQVHRSGGEHVPRHSRSHRDQRHSRHRRHSHRHGSSSEDEPCKESCYKCLAVGMSFRWILVVLSLLGVCCVVTGIVLAALHAAGNSFLFLAIMFIGLGVLLVVVVGVGWKCTPRGHEPLHALFHLGEFRTRRSGRRRRTHRHRDGRWYGGTMYPEFQYRRPPPSYNASMQQQQAMAAQQVPQTPDLYDPNNLPDEDYSLPSSPPPSYRSRASTVRAGIQITFPPNQGGDYPDSRPPTYRSHQGQGRTRPSLSRDEDDYDDDDAPAPADVAFTGSAVFVDTSTNQNGTSIQIDPSVVSNQNVTVSVTTVSVTTQPAQSESSGHLSALETPGALTAEGSNEEIVDPVGTDYDGDKVQTAL